MPCRLFNIKDDKGNVVGHGLACSRGRKNPPCAFCSGPSTLLCDGVIAPGKTCDKPICNKCTRKVFHHSGKKDLCPECVKAGRKCG